MPQTILMGDGSKKAISDAQVQAMRAIVVGEATKGQQLAAMALILGDLCKVGGFNPMGMSEREAGFSDGSRWVGITIAAIAGGPDPFVLKRMDEAQRVRDGDDREGGND